MKIKPIGNPSRLTLKGWATLDDIRRSIEKRAEAGEWQAVPDLIFQSLELACGEVDRENFWEDVAEAYAKTLEVNSPQRKFPILTGKKESKPLPWEYEGRGWYFWLNLFARVYGWPAGEIANLDIDDAIGLFEEISIDEQMQKEWEWGLSEMAYPYNASTKKSKFKPLSRPDWMKPEPGPKKKVKTEPMPARMFPVGEIIILDED